MTKILTGATISYGATLPPPATTVDGSLFFLTTGYTDPQAVVRLPGLHLYSFQTDVSSVLPGEQVGQGWKQLSSLDTYVKTTGDTMTGALNVLAGIKAQRGYPVDNSSNVGYTFGIDGDTGMFRDPGATNAATDLSFYVNGVERLKITTAGVITASGSIMWNAANDGAGSGLDADLLDGQQGAFYLDLTNSTGALNLATNTTGILPVTRGGTGSTAALIAGGVLYASSTTASTSNAAGTASQVLLSGGTGAPTWANQSTLSVGTALAATGNTFSTAGSGAGIENRVNVPLSGYDTISMLNNTVDCGIARSVASGFIISYKRSNGYIYLGDAISSPRVHAHGELHCSGDIVAYSSDARLKTNVKIIPNAMDKIKTLGGYEYDWDMEKTRRLGFKPTNKHEHGLLAQEVQKVLPDAVAAAPFNSDYLTVKYERLVALLVAGMNEQQEQINSLQAQIVSMSQKL